MPLRHVADAGAAAGRQFLAVVAQDGRGAAGRSEQAQQHANRGGLAGAVAADERKDAAPRHAERDVVCRALTSEVARQASALDRRLTPSGRRSGIMVARGIHVDAPADLSLQSSASRLLSTADSISSAVKSSDTASRTNDSAAARSRRSRSALL